MDLCKSGLWDIVPGETCPKCGAMPDTDCLGTTAAASIQQRAAVIDALLHQIIEASDGIVHNLADLAHHEIHELAASLPACAKMA